MYLIGGCILKVVGSKQFLWALGPTNYLGFYSFPPIRAITAVRAESLIRVLLWEEQTDPEVSQVKISFGFWNGDIFVVFHKLLG